VRALMALGVVGTAIWTEVQGGELSDPFIMLLDGGQRSTASAHTDRSGYSDLKRDQVQMSGWICHESRLTP